MFDPSHTSRIALFVSLNIFVIGCTKAPQGVTVRCEEDEYVEDGECVACPAGSTNTSDAYAGGDTKCEPTRCSVNQRVEEHRCVDCEPGTTRTAGDEATGANTFCEVSVCGADEHVQGGECVACPAGTTNEPGDRRTDGDSPCEPVLCQMNEHVESNVCVACEPGTANDAGDDSSAGDTACDVTTCELDHFVESNTCVPCPDDTINDAGDAANGPDSSCRDAICGRNERVSLRQCIPCAQDMINLPGDHAALGDTSCTPAVISMKVQPESTCALLATGRVMCWGGNTFGTVNSDDVKWVTTPTQLGLPGRARQIDGGAAHNCALLETGEVYCWGSNIFGQLGPIEPRDNYETVHKHPPRLITDLPHNGYQLSMGNGHTCLLTRSQTVYCWGNNIRSDDPLGYEPPTKVNDLPNNVVKLFSGGHSTCALTDNDELWCWGSNESQRLKAAPDEQPIPIPEKMDWPGMRHETLSLQSHGACIVSREGDAYCRGRDLLQHVPPLEPGRFHKVDGLPNDIKEVHNGIYSACALSEAQGLYCWGIFIQPSFQVYPPTRVAHLRDGVLSTSINFSHACVLMRDGHMKCRGDNRVGQLGVGDMLESRAPSHHLDLPAPPIQINAGKHSTCAVLAGGKSYCWGDNTYGQSGNGTTISSSSPLEVSAPTLHFSSVSQSLTHACALDISGEAYCWGDNQHGQLGDLTSVQRTRPTPTSAIRSGVQQIVVGLGHTCALSNDHEIFCWGANNAGQLATSTPSSSVLPLPITLPGSQPTKLASGSNHICALTMIGDVMCWGGNYSGQIDASDPAQTIHAPQIRSGLGPNVVDINANGSNHTCAVLANGSLQCWGENQYGQLGNGNVNATADVVTIESDGAPYVQVSPGAQHTCAIRSDGSVWCWGDNQTGRFHTSEQQLIQTPIRIEGLSPAVAISSGINHTCALDANGLMLCWGSNVRGQLGGNRLLSSEDFIDVEF